MSESREWFRDAVAVWKEYSRTPPRLRPFWSWLSLSTWFLLYLIGETIPIPFSELYPVRPLLVLIPVYYWSFRRPDSCSPLMVVALGVVRDLVVGAPLGVSPACLLIAFWAGSRHARVVLGRSFINIWIRFSLTASLAYSTVWATMWLAGSPLPAVTPSIVSYCVLVALYPLSSLVFEVFHPWRKAET